MTTTVFSLSSMGATSGHRKVSGNKPNRCEYEQLSPVEGNNNRPERNKKSGKNKNDRHRRFGSIDNDGNGNDDDSSSQEDDDEDSGKWSGYPTALTLYLITITREYRDNVISRDSFSSISFRLRWGRRWRRGNRQVNLLGLRTSLQVYTKFHLFPIILNAVFSFNSINLVRFYSSTRILERHKIRERHFGWVGHFLFTA